jgi:hypothetical protein
MRKLSSLTNRTNTSLPARHATAHDLCFTIHDVMTKLLICGRNASVFQMSFALQDEADRLAFEQMDVFEWLDMSGRVDERADLLVTTVFPAVLSDMLHFIYESLETSRKGKLTIAYALLRKPLQESLSLLEYVVVDRAEFASRLAVNPVLLEGRAAGGVEQHNKRIQNVLDVLREQDRFDASYIAQLCYDNKSNDSFDGICQKAIHLFTKAPAILTEPMNINFIFSDIESAMTQWDYLYSRLPYLMVYMHLIVEYICGTIVKTDHVYVDDINRRISALVLLWWETVFPPYREAHLESFVDKTRSWLHLHCEKAGYRSPNRRDLIKMADTGAYPGEARASVAQRNLKYRLDAAACGSLGKPASEE